MKLIVAAMVLVFFLGGSAAAQAAETCQHLGAPAINVTISTAQPHFDYSLTQAKMAQYAEAAHLPAADVYDLTVNAMSTGDLHIDRQVKLTGQKLQDGLACVQVTEVNVHIHINPVIYIAQELHDEGCEFKEYYLHEMKHVEEDRKLVGDYKAVIARNMAFAFPDPIDYSTNTVPLAQAEVAAQTLRDNIEGALSATFDSMMRERRERQRMVDNTGEFMRLTRVCGEGGAGVKPELRRDNDKGQ